MIRISLGPGEVAGYFAGLKEGFDEIGVESEHFLLYPNKFGYRRHRHFLSRHYEAAGSLRACESRLLRMAGRIWALVLKMIIFAYAVARYDVFIFSGFESFFRWYDLPILKLLNKKIIVVFLGTDARPPILSGRHLDDEGGLVDPAVAYAETREICRRIHLVERYADHIINHTATDQFFTRDYVRFAAIGLPVRPAERDEEAEPRPRIKIVHAPSRPIAKGTAVFRDAIDDLRSDGFSIDYVELIGVPNSRVLAELASCDFVVDELYSDVPLAMFATEAAMFAKPAVVGSYYADDFRSHNPDDRQPPSVFVRPEAVKASIRRLVEDADYRKELGARAREFVCGQWNAAAVARRVVQVIEGAIPESWTSDPCANCYIWGWGLSEEAWRSQVGSYVDCNGFEALLIGHNAALADKIRSHLSSR